MMSGPPVNNSNSSSGSNGSNNLVVNVSIEASDEYQVQEIGLDGQEKHVLPLSMSENLSRLAQRIDFSATSVDGEEEMQVSESTEGRELTSFQPSLWPWDSVRNKLKNAYTEVSVLLDVLKIAKEKKYMVLDPVRPPDPLDNRQVAIMVAKKKALQTAAQIVMAGAERLRQSHSDSSRNRSAADFHAELMLMRQNWRMRKVGNTILGDLSYRSVGSRFPHSGTFHITKNETADTSPSAPGSTSRPSALKVTVPPDLEGVAYVHVSVQKSNESLSSYDLSIPMPPNAAVGWDSTWKGKLESAANVLFCKEVFAQLAREAVQVQLPVPTIVMGNQIIATLSPEFN